MQLAEKIHAKIDRLRDEAKRILEFANILSSILHDEEAVTQLEDAPQGELKVFTPQEPPKKRGRKPGQKNKKAPSTRAARKTKSK